MLHWQFLLYYQSNIPPIKIINESIIGVYKKVPAGKFLPALSSITVALYLVATMLITYYFSVTNVVERTCRYLVYFAGFCFAKLVVAIYSFELNKKGILQACHCADVPFEQYRFSIILPATLLNANTIVGYITKY